MLHGLHKDRWQYSHCGSHTALQYGQAAKQACQKLHELLGSQLQHYAYYTISFTGANGMPVFATAAATEELHLMKAWQCVTSMSNQR